MPISELGVEEVADLVSFTKESDTKVCLLIGAGASKSAGIGLASDFVEKIKSAYPAIYKRACRTRSVSEPSYADCMAELPPARQVQLVRQEVDAAKLNWAHIGMARLERDGIVDTVLTPNFDPLASRACALFNRFPAVYDLAGLRDFSKSHIDFDKSYVKGSAIFHLHGQHSGFLLLNTEEKLINQAKRIRPVIDAVMKGKPVIISGYSGENDPLIDEIAALAPFNHGLFWICHDSSNPASNVCDKLLSLDDCHIVRSSPSDQFFTDLANHLGVRSPSFLVNPFSHLAELLNGLRPFTDIGVRNGPDMLQQAKDDLSFAAQKAAELRPDQRRLAELMSTGREAEAWESFSTQTSTLSEEDRTEVAWAGAKVAERLTLAARHSEGREADEMFRDACKIYERAHRISPNLGSMINNWGVTLSHQATQKSGAAGVRLAKRAQAKFRQAIKMDSSDNDAPANLASSLIDLARFENRDMTSEEIIEATALLEDALSLGSQSAAYNLACLYAVNGDAEACAKVLISAYDNGDEIPDCHFVISDEDFNKVKDHEAVKDAFTYIGCVQQ